MSDNEFKVGSKVMYMTFEEVENYLIDMGFVRNNCESKALFSKGDAVEFRNSSNGSIHIRKVVIDSMQGVIGIIRKVTDYTAFNSRVVLVDFPNNSGCLTPVPSWRLKRAVQHINIME